MDFVWVGTVSKRTLRNSICLIGGGGHALVVAEAAQLAEQQVIGFFDDRESGSLMHLASTWLGKIEDGNCLHLDVARILAVGDLDFRVSLQEVINGIEPVFNYGTVIHPRAIVSDDAVLAGGTFVAAGAVVNCGAAVGIHGIVNTRAVVEHDCEVGANVHVGPGAVLGGGVRIGSRTLIGLNASVKPNVSIGKNCVVGAGAVVVQDVCDNDIVIGVPARSISRSEFESRRSA